MGHVSDLWMDDMVRCLEIKSSYILLLIFYLSHCLQTAFFQVYIFAGSFGLSEYVIISVHTSVKKFPLISR